MFFYPTFFKHQNFRRDLTYMWVPLKLPDLVLNHSKIISKGFLDFVTRMKLFFNLFGQIEHGSLPTNKLRIGFPMRGWTHLVIACSKKIKCFEDNLLLVFQSSSLKNVLNKKTSSFGAFLRQIGLLGPNPQKVSKYYCRF